MEINKNERLKSVINYLKGNGAIYNEADFSKKTEISKSFLSDMKKGSKIISEQSILKITGVFEELNANWLLTGEGSMLKSDNRLLSTETPIATEQSESKISREMEIIASQQQTIERLTKIIENLTLK